MLKRSPEVVMPTAVEFVKSLKVRLSIIIAFLLTLEFDSSVLADCLYKEQYSSFLQADLGRYVAEVLPLIISELRHADEPRRANAVAVVRSVVLCCCMLM